MSYFQYNILYCARLSSGRRILRSEGARRWRTGIRNNTRQAPAMRMAGLPLRGSSRPSTRGVRPPGFSRPFSCLRIGLGQPVQVKPSRTFIQGRHFFKRKGVPCWRKGETPLVIAVADIKSCHKMLQVQMVDETGRQGFSEGFAVCVSRFPFLFLQHSTLFALAFRVRDKLGQCHLRAAGGELDFEGVRKNPAPTGQAVLRKVRVRAWPCSQIARTRNGISDTGKRPGKIRRMFSA
jgi:hypothetical protein